MFDYLVTAFQPIVPPFARIVREQSPNAAADSWFKAQAYDARAVPEGLVIAVTEVVPHESPLTSFTCRTTHAYVPMLRVDLVAMELPF